MSYNSPVTPTDSQDPPNHPPDRSVDFTAQREDRWPIATGEAGDGVAVAGHEGVEIHELADAVTDVIQGSGHHRAAVGVADEHDVVKVFVQDLIDDIRHVRAQTDLGTGEMNSLPDPHPGQTRREHVMALLQEDAANRAPAMSSAPPAMHQHERGHPLEPCTR